MRHYLTDEEKLLPSRELARRYGVLSKNCYRIRKQGWIVLGYRNKRITIGDWQADEIVESARKGVYGLLRRQYRGDFTFFPFEAEDIVHMAVIRLIELSGDPRFHFPAWRVGVACNEARRFFRDQCQRHNVLRIFDFERFEDIAA